MNPPCHLVDVWQAPDLIIGYTSDGKADDVTDAAGHRFVTSYNEDGVVNSVTRTDGTSTTLVSYAYGSTDATITNGMPTQITDGLSGVVQHLSYVSSGDGIGQVYSVVEDNGSDEYSSTYGYDGAGNRSTVKYATPSATNYWRYDLYNRVGMPDNPKFAFQNLTKTDSSYNCTSEAMHYLYDSQGRLDVAALPKLQPQPVRSPMEPGTTPEPTPPPSGRGRFYTYDPAGRVLSVDHWWDTWSSGSYSSTYLVGNACSYEIGTGDNRGLKTGDTFLKDVSGSAATAWTQSYGYDGNFDYLTSASYGDSQPNATQSWTYDAAGNRTGDYTGTGWTYDNLNRMTANGVGTGFSNDILGNRTAISPSGVTAGSYTWDCLNRMTASHQPGISGGGTSPASMGYTYRADGMRVEKILHSGEYSSGVPGGPPAEEINDVYTRYRYDGQMPMETYVIKADSSTVLTVNGLGARGLDYTSVTNSSGTTVVFPIYDAHGNEVASLSRSGSSYSLTNQRSYGAWGEVRQGATTGGPRGRYCGNLGHVQDDETGLVYMRARYYEAGSGRFLSQDLSMNGTNWFGYCQSDPVNCVDESGRVTARGIQGIWLTIAGMALVLGAIISGYYAVTPAQLAAATLALAAGFFLLAVATEHIGNEWLAGAMDFTELGGGLHAVMQFWGTLYPTLGTEVGGLAESKYDGIAGGIVASVAIYAMMLCFLIALTNSN